MPILALLAAAADYSAPAGMRPAIRRPGAASIIPSGRIINPLGQQYLTGPGPFGLALGPNGRFVVSSNGGPDRYSLTVLESGKNRPWTARHLVAPRPRRGEESNNDDDWRSVFMGLAFAGERNLYASEGNSGRVRLVDLQSGQRRRAYDLNQDGYRDSYTGDLAYDAQRGLLYVADQANFRLAVIDTHKNRVAASVRIGRLPFAVALSSDGRRAYVTNIGMFEYQPLPGADPNQPLTTGLPFPAFGFPSAEARDGAKRNTERGEIAVPGLGDPNVRESNSVAVINVEDPVAPKVETFIRTGLPFGDKSLGGSSPSGVIAAAGRVFVSNGHNDTITVIDPASNSVASEIAIRIPGLEDVRGVLPMGMAYHEPTGWLLVAEAGINAVAVIDTRTLRVIGHLPVGWFPTRVVADRGTIYVANARGEGTGPNADRDGQSDTFIGTIRRGSISIFPVPEATQLASHTETVIEFNGLRPRQEPAGALPEQVRYVVLIVKENRTFDEVFGDIRRAGNGPVTGYPPLARFGANGYVSGGGSRLSVQGVNVTPNHHAMAAGWAFSDNFYADSDVSVDGHHWVVGSYPDAWTQSSLMAAYGGQKDFRLPTSAPGRLNFPQSNSSVHPEEQLEAGAIWHHFERHGIPFRNFGEGFELAGVVEDPGEKPTGARYLTNVPMPDPLYRNTSREYPQYNMNIPDQYRADRFIQEIGARYVKGGEEFPRFIFIHLPNDHMAKPRPEDGYPFEASYVADNDYALGRMLEYLSNTRWWREMAVFVTEDDAQGGRDHIDAHRTVLLIAGPYTKRNYVSHTHSSFPGLLKTIFRLFGMPPLNLFDAVASDLSDCFTSAPEFTSYKALPPDPRLFVPEKARDPRDPQPGPALDDPGFIRNQHRGSR